MYCLYLIIIMTIVLIFYNIYSFFCGFSISNMNKKMREGMENSTDKELSILVYKNAGAIDNLQKESINLKNDTKQIYKNQTEIIELNKQVSKLLQEAKLAETTNDKQDTLINEIKKEQERIKEYTTKAYTTSQENKERFVKLANASKEKSDAAQKESDSISYT